MLDRVEFRRKFCQSGSSGAGRLRGGFAGGNTGASGYYRVDWLTPDGLRTWGDGRTLILGTKGYIELRKYIDIASADAEKDVLFIVDQQGERRIECAGKVGFPFFGQLILDCLNRTENAMTRNMPLKPGALPEGAAAFAADSRLGRGGKIPPFPRELIFDKNTPTA